MKGLLTAATIVTLSMGAAGLSARQNQSAQDGAKNTEIKPAPPAQPNTHAVLPNDANYVIGPSDMLNIDIWKQPDISRTIPVRPDGKISLPLLNDVQASGLTPLQLEAELTDKLKGFVNSPQVTVIVTQVNSQRVYVLGQIGRPGPVDMLPDMTVLQAIAAAGGPAQFAKDKSIYILRNENGKQQKIPFNYPDVIKGKHPEQNILLKPGDTIVVP
jgi:polysaccharide biosynthesis/export protein